MNFPELAKGIVQEFSLTSEQVRHLASELLTLSVVRQDMIEPPEAPVGERPVDLSDSA